MISLLRKLFGGASPASDDTGAASDEQAVLIRILAEDVQKDDPVNDLVTLEDDLQDLLEEHGEVDGHDVGDVDANLYIYGRSAEKIFELIRSHLSENELTSRALVTLRFGPPGSPESIIQLPHDR